jgi:hypothetical protein
VVDVTRFEADDGGYGYSTLGHVDLAEFMVEVRAQVEDDDKILNEEPEHVWACYEDGEEDEELEVYIELCSKSRIGSFPMTWIQFD